MSAAEDRPPEPPPEDGPSTPGPAPDASGGPVPVRDLMRRMSPSPAESAPAAEAAAETPARSFEHEGERWIVRVAGEGAYGTGRAGAARLVALHFYRAADPGTPLREALIPAAAFEGMAEEELRACCVRATPIDLDR